MTENDMQIEGLILKWARREPLTPEEQAILDEWQDRSGEHGAVPDRFRDEEWVRKSLARLNRIPSERIWQKIAEKAKQEKHIKTPWYRPAAAIVAAAVAIFWIARPFFIADPSRLKDSSAENQASVNPFPMLAALVDEAFVTGHKEVLTLPDGRKLDISGIPKGPVAGAGIGINKTDSDVIEYQTGAALKEPGIAGGAGYHTLSTGMGRIRPFRLLLADGTKVSLGVGSSIRYPGVFAGTERRVFLSGEAFFEIAKNPSKPFIVQTTRGDTRDIGTSFNIMAYPDEAVVKVTLITGIVQVQDKKDVNDIVELNHPLQQVQLGPDGLKTRTPIQLKSADDAIAWQHGVFHFAHTDLREAMRELGRWYHKTVVFTGNVQGSRLDINLGRGKSWEEALGVIKDLENGFALFTVEGDGVRVSPTRTGN